MAPVTDPVSDSDDAQHREDHDAATPPRRSWRWWAVLVVALIAVMALVALCGKDPPPPPPPPPPPVVELPPAPLPVIEARPPSIQLPPTPEPKKTKPKKTATAPSKRAAVEAVGSTVVVTGGQGGGSAVHKATERALRGRLSSVEVPASEANYSLTVQIQESKANADEVTVRCAVSIALLPKKNVVASLKARADAAGEGTPTAELFDDAATACGQTLGGDIRAWLKRH